MTEAVESAKFLLVQDRLGRDLREWMEEQRKAGRSWRQISTILFERANVDVAGETLRLWAEQR